MTRSLEEKGLLVNESDAVLARFLPVLVMLTVAGIGAVKIGIGLSRHRAVEYLFLFVILTVVIAFAGFARRVFRSQYGEAVLERLR